MPSRAYYGAVIIFPGPISCRKLKCVAVLTEFKAASSGFEIFSVCVCVWPINFSSKYKNFGHSVQFNADTLYVEDRFPICYLILYKDQHKYRRSINIHKYLISSEILKKYYFSSFSRIKCESHRKHFTTKIYNHTLLAKLYLNN